jgi:PAS domain S-box-containing protein
VNRSDSLASDHPLTDDVLAAHALAYDIFPEAVLIIDCSGFIRYRNPKALSLLRSQYTDTERVHLQTVFGIEQTAVLLSWMSHNVAPSQGGSIEFDVPLPEGRTQRVQCALIMLHGSGREVTGMLLTLREVTQAMQNESERRRQQNAWFEVLTETAQDMIYIIEADGNIRYVNKRAAEQLGRDRSDIIGKRHADFFHGDTRERQMAGILRVFRTGEAVYAETPNALSSNLRWLGTWLLPIVEDGQVTAIMGISRDITGQRMASEELRASEERFRGVFERSPLGIATTTADGRLLSVNDAFCKMLGYSSEELRETGLSLVTISAEDEIHEREYIQSMLNEGRDLFTLEKRYLARSGSIVWASVSFAVIRDSSGTIQSIVGMVEDITSRRKTEEELRKLSRAVEQSPSGIMITDTQGVISYVNPSFTEITGYSYEEVIGQRPSILKSGEMPESLYAELWETITRGQTWRGELHNRNKRGELYWEAASISPVKTLDGSTTHFIAVKEDITQKKRIEQELIQAKEKAERSDRLKDAFIANISHEIRSPLNVIVGYTRLIHESFRDRILPEEEHYFQSIDRGTERIIRTVEEILNIAKLQSGTYNLKFEYVEVDTCLDKLVLDMQPGARAKNLILAYESACANLFVLADRYSFGQALINIIDNAIKYTMSGSIIVRLDQTDGKVRVSVTDTGIGISDDYLPRLFSTFSQETTGFTRPFDGVGLGMALTKQYVEMNKGTIDVRSRKGSGTRVILTFPSIDEFSLFDTPTDNASA